MSSALSFRLNSESKRIVEQRTGMTANEISSASNQTITRNLENKAGKVFKPSSFHGIADQLGRGQVYPFANRLISNDFIKRNL